MAVATTLKSILEEVARRTGLGLPLTVTADTTTITGSSNNELKGPFTASRFPIGAPIRVTAGGATTDNAYVSAYSPSAGTITVSPTITTAATACLVAYDLTLEHWDWVVQAVNRAIANRAGRWRKTALTFVPDGDMQGATVADYWTAAANGTAAYATAQAFPAGSAADVAGPVGLSRVVQLTSDGVGASSVTGNGIRTQLTTQNRAWYFKTAIRLVSGTGTASFVMRDNTNSADITLQIVRGNDALTLTTTTFGDFLICEGTFQVPATCAEIAPRLVLSALSMVAQMAPVILFPLDAMTFPLPNRIDSENFIGNFYYGTTLSNPGGIESIAFSEAITQGGATHHFDNQGDHLSVTFNFRPTSPVYFDEYANDPALSAITDTTTLPLDYIADWAAYELLEFISRRKRTKEGTAAAKAALRTALGGAYGGETITVAGRV